MYEFIKINTPAVLYQGIGPNLQCCLLLGNVVYSDNNFSAFWRNLLPTSLRFFTGCSSNKSFRMLVYSIRVVRGVT
jgi:hypothetical protein